MIKLGVSSCVIGNKVRFDGGHKRSGFVAGHIDKFFELVPFCPEVGMGMPVPRPTIRLMEHDEVVRLVDSKDAAIDHTVSADRFFASISGDIPELDGYILAAKSPSCGMERIKVYDTDGNTLHRKGRGVFAAQLIKTFPHLPVEEDGRLNDQGIRESFFTRVIAHNEFRCFVLHEPSLKTLVKFHSRYKFLLLAHHPELYYAMGQLVGNGKNMKLEELLFEYQCKMMSALKKPSSRKRHTNVLMHIQGFFKNKLEKDDKAELMDKIEQYRRGYIPLMAPLTLLNHHLNHFPNPYLEDQKYFSPYPLELGLQA